MVIGIDASRAEAKIKTGVERYSFELIKAMRQNLPPETEVVLYSRVPLGPDLGPFNGRWKNKVLGWPPKYFWTQLRLSWEMLLRAPDALFIPSHELPRIIPKNTVKTVHDAFFMDFPKMFPLRERFFLKAALFDACRRARSIIVPSNYVAKQIKRWRSKNVRVIPLGVRFPGQFEKTDPRSNEKYFVVLGRIEKKKNLGVAIEAFEKFSAGHPDHKLYFVGRFASGSEDIVGRAQTSPAVSRIEFLGALPDAEMFPLLSGAVALIHPCPYEGFGIPAIEAMALGVPVIAASAGAIAEVVGEAGLLVAPTDAIKWSEAMNQITFDIFRSTLIEKGKKRVADFSWEKCAKEVWKTIRE